MPFRLSRTDLDYLLRNVRIGTDYNQLFGPLDPGGVREVRGTNNNLVGGWDNEGNWAGTNPHWYWGSADTNFLRLSFPNTPDGAPHGVTYDLVNPQLPLFDFMNPMTDQDNTVFDATPRLITNLISSMVIDPTSDVFNPAAVASMENAGLLPGVDQNGNIILGDNDAISVNNSVVGSLTGAFIPNPGILGGIPYNEFFVAFGQFFDHGLDFISKGGGFVMIPLSPGDPLYVDPSDPSYVEGVSNMMMLSRASLANPDSDFNPDGTLVDGATPQWNNNTGLLIDQSQTYGSHEAINALVRQYDANGEGTGFLITGAEDGRVMVSDGMGGFVADTSLATLADATHDLATWDDMKANALRIGVELVDMDVTDAPWIRASSTGELLFDSSPLLVNGSYHVTYLAGETLLQTQARVFADTGVEVGMVDLMAHDPYYRAPDGTAARTNQPVLADMGVNASPVGHMGEPLNPFDPGLGNPINPTEYDAGLLGRHYVSGDGRVNENVGLTAVHHIFHEEHNVQAQSIMDSVLNVAAEILDAGGTMADAVAYVNEWTEAGAGLSDNVAVFDYIDLDGNAQTVMLEGVRVNASGGVNWDGDAVYQAARIITESEYNHIAIDQYMGGLYPALPEFVSYSADIDMSISLEFSQAVFRLGHSMLTEYMQLAVPDAEGDLPGTPDWTPTFDEQGLFDAFTNPDMYAEYGPAGITIGLMRQQGNEVDEFVTPALQQSLLGIPLDLGALNIARGRDVGLPTLNELRQQIYEGYVEINGSGAGSSVAPYTSWADFGNHLRTPESLVNFIAAYGGVEGDGWNLAEMRAAYLNGTATLQEVRANAQLLLDAYDGGDAAAATFMEGMPTYTNGVWTFEGQDMGFWDIDLWIGGLAEMPLFDGPLGTTFSYIMLDFAQRLQDGDRFYYLYRMPVGHHLGDQIIGEQFADLIERTTGTQHIGEAFGIQSLYLELDDAPNFWNAALETLDDGSPAIGGHIVVAGNGGDDFIVGGFGDDYLYGDAGDDILQGSQGNDHLYGGAGNDFITDDENDDFIDGGAGDDILYGGPGAIDTLHGNIGNDEVHGGDGIDEVFGDDGDDSLFGEGDTDLMIGGEGNDFMDGGDSVDEMFGGNGNDWMRGGVGDDNINGGSGNDLLEGGLGPTANDGDRLNGDSPVTIGTTIIEWNGDGTEGDMDIASYEEAHIAIIASLQTSNANGTSSNLADTYAYLEGLVGSAMNDRLEGADENTSTSNGANNYLIGGGGDDMLYGLGGDDFIFGDNIVVDVDLYVIGDSRHTHGLITGWTTFQGDIRPIFEDGTIGHLLGQGVDGNDVIDGGAGNDFLCGGGGRDTVDGGSGNDMLRGDEGDDRLSGGSGNDHLYGGWSYDILHGDAGNDFLWGGNGMDTLYGDSGQDELHGELGNDSLYGGTGNDMLYGDDGNDRLDGGSNNDTLLGGIGDDILIGNTGRDTMTGGAGADTFRFGNGHSGAFTTIADIITDFTRADGDHIDLSQIDAIAGGGDNAFTFIGMAAFSGAAGELRYYNAGGGTLMVAGDTNGDGTADFFIAVNGSADLVQADFVL